jgi:hypothetical protein
MKPKFSFHKDLMNQALSKNKIWLGEVLSVAEAVLMMLENLLPFTIFFRVCLGGGLWIEDNRG